MSLKRTLAALLLAVILISSSCAPRVQSPSDTGTSESADNTLDVTETKEVEDPNRKITLFDGDGWTCGAVTASACTDSERSFLSSLQSELSSIIKVSLPTSTDKDQGAEDATEIIIGYTAHPVMRSLYSTLGYGDACIKVVGSKILVAAYTQAGYTELLEHIFKVMRNGRGSGRIEITVSELETLIEVDTYLNRIPLASGLGLPSISDCGINQRLLLYKNANADDYDRYVSALDKDSRVHTRSAAGNHFSTFSAESDTINVSFSKSESALRIIYTVNHSPTELFAKKEVSAVCEPLLIMRGMAWQDEKNEKKINGLCILIRLHDGRFIIVDGGWDRQRDADDLYRLLSENTPDGMKPTVAAWIITHAHEDHHSAFAFDFPNTYRQLVDVENVIFNPPMGGIYIGSNPSGHATNEKEVLTAIGKLGARLVRAHVGDKYYIGDAVIDVLYTADLIYPEQFEYYNTSSLMLSIEIAGQRIMITGDGSNAAFDKMADMFGTSLKCDVVQVAHHGYGTGVAAKESTGIVRGYTYMAPSLLLWPSNEAGYQSGLKSSYNIALVRLPTIKKIIVAGENDHSLKLPYKAS